MSDSATLTRDQLLAAAAAPLPSERVDVPELGGVVLVRGLSAAERDAFEQTVMLARRRQRPLVNVRARLAATCLVDDAGTALFTPADIEQLGQLRADVLDRIVTVAQRLSGFLATDLQELEDAQARAEA